MHCQAKKKRETNASPSIVNVIHQVHKHAPTCDYTHNPFGSASCNLLRRSLVSTFSPTKKKDEREKETTPPTRTMFPPLFFHQMRQLRRPVARMLRTVHGDLLFALFAPHVVTVHLRTDDVDRLRVVFAVHRGRTLAPVGYRVISQRNDTGGGKTTYRRQWIWMVNSASSISVKI